MLRSDEKKWKPTGLRKLDKLTTLYNKASFSELLQPV